MIESAVGGRTGATAAPGLFLDEATRIASRVAASAIWDRDACTWLITTIDYKQAAMRTPRTVLAGPHLYQGSAGIGLFFAELYSLTGAPWMLGVARGALNHALRLAADLPDSSQGFHAGRTGIAYCCWRLAIVSADERYEREARTLLIRVIRAGIDESSLDVIAGAAGAVPILLMMGSAFEMPTIIARATELSRLIVRKARRRPVGWSWAGGFYQARDLAGLAHGAAGLGHALMEAGATTRNWDFLYGAAQAFAYEEALFDATANNWPDFRYSALSDTLRSPPLWERLRSRGVTPETLTPFKPSSMLAWCHGAPGIGLTRLRAYELSGHRPYALQAQRAVDATMAAMQDVRIGHSLCHGLFGNCELLFEAARAFNRPEIRDAGDAFVCRAIDESRSNGGDYRSGTLGAVHEPSLMLGECGIGYALARRASRAVPSILLPTNSASLALRFENESTTMTRRTCVRVLTTLAEGDARHYFARSLDVFARLQPKAPGLLRVAARGTRTTGLSLLESLHSTIVRRIGDENDPRVARLMRDATLPEVLRYQRARALDDYSVEVTAAVTREPPDRLLWHSVAFRLATHAEVAKTEFDWDVWLATDSSAGPQQRPTHWLVHLAGGEIRIRALGPLAAAVLRACVAPIMLRDICAQLARLHVFDTARAVVGTAPSQNILDQVREAYCAGILVAAPAPDANVGLGDG